MAKIHMSDGSKYPFPNKTAGQVEQHIADILRSKSFFITAKIGARKRAVRLNVHHIVAVED